MRRGRERGESNVLTMNTLCLMEGCSARGGGHLLEHPADPECDPLPSIFATPEVCEWEQRTSSKRVSFHQCMLGGPTMKPTMISSTFDLIEALDELWCDGSHDHERTIGVEGGVHLTRRLASYPGEMCKLIAECIIATLLRFAATGAGPTGWRRSSAPALASRRGPTSARLLAIAPRLSSTRFPLEEKAWWSTVGRLRCMSMSMTE